MKTENIFSGTSVTMDALLQSRDERIMRQKAMLAGGTPCLISLTMNIPGEIKCFPLAQKAFHAGLEEIYRYFSHQITDTIILELPTGCEAQLAISADPADVKYTAVTIELTHPLGRLYDIDILTPEGIAISRQELGFPPRKCLLCGKNAKLCGRSRAHTISELRDEVVSLLEECF